MVHSLRVTRGQAAGHKALQALAAGHPGATGRAARRRRGHRIGLETPSARRLRQTVPRLGKASEFFKAGTPYPRYLPVACPIGR